MPQLILLRGLPGAGKSRLANLLSDNGRWPCFSVDDYFTDPKNGHYAFRFEDNHLAYARCREQTEAAMQAGTGTVLVHNTFTMDWEITPYLDLASRFNYDIYVATVEKYHNAPNLHGVSEEQLEKMAAKYKVKLL